MVFSSKHIVRSMGGQDKALAFLASFVKENSPLQFYEIDCGWKNVTQYIHIPTSTVPHKTLHFGP